MAHGLRLGVGVLVLSTAVGCWSTDKPPSTFPASVKLPDPKLPAAAPAAKGATANRSPSTPAPVQTTAAGPTDRFGRPAGSTPPPTDPGAGMPPTLPGLTQPAPAPTVPNNAGSFREPTPIARPAPPSDGGSPIVSPPAVKPLPMPEPPPPPALPAVAPPTAKADGPAAPSMPTAPITLPTPGGDGK